MQLLHRCALLFLCDKYSFSLFLPAPGERKLNFDHRALDRNLGEKIGGGGEISTREYFAPVISPVSSRPRSENRVDFPRRCVERRENIIMIIIIIPATVRSVIHRLNLAAAYPSVTKGRRFIDCTMREIAYKRIHIKKCDINKFFVTIYVYTRVFYHYGDYGVNYRCCEIRNISTHSFLTRLFCTRL